MKTKILSTLFMISMFLMLSFQIVMPVNAAEKTLDTKNPGNLPTTSVESAENKIEKKAWNIISLCQTVGKPICIIGFIISALIALFGALGRKGAMPGLIGCLIAGVMYVAINYAPEIVSFIQAFIVN